MANIIVSIAVNTPFNQSILSYLVDPDMAIRLRPGVLVKVPLGKRLIEGCYLGHETKNDVNVEKLKKIDSINEDLFIHPFELEMFQWMSHYYHYPLGQIIFDTLPTQMKRPRKLNFIQGEQSENAYRLTEEQEKIVKGISLNRTDEFHKYLVHGVTGAGKTVIYLELAKSILAEKKSVLFLLPEINLTPQFLETFKKQLNVPTYSYNSAISNSDKYGLWKLLQEDDSPKLILGVRSSVFLPIKSLGIIFVDEEHDQSFKQDDRCAYNARDVAIKKASLLKIPVVLGSATPMVETYKNFIQTNNKRN